MRAREFTEPTAAGCILYAEDTGRWGLQQRSDTVGDPGVWAAWGGGREPGESLEQCVLRELAEESGYRGPIKLEPLSKNAKYATFIGIVPQEFEPRSCDEWKDFCWVELGHWPSPMHPGVAAALENVYIKENLAEAFNQPYPIKWEKSEHGDYDALATLSDGTHLSIMFEHTTPYEVEVSFWRNNSLEVTGEGDAQRVFATVLTAIQQFLKIEQPANISFSASKEVEPGQNSESRAKLYNRLVDRYAASWGYDSRHFDHGDQVTYELTQYPSDGPFESTFTENFADGKVRGKSRPGRVKRSGASCSGSVTDLRAKAKKYGGERGKMYHWCANMKSGRKKTNEATVGSLTIGPFEIVVDDHSFERAVQREINTSDIDNTLRKIKLPRVAKQMLNFETGSRFYIFDHSNNVALGLRRIGQNRFVLKTVYNGKPMDLNIAGIITI